MREPVSVRSRRAAEAYAKALDLENLKATYDFQGVIIADGPMTVDERRELIEYLVAWDEGEDYL